MKYRAAFRSQLRSPGLIRGKREKVAIVAIAALAVCIVLAACPAGAGAKPKASGHRASARGLFGTNGFETPSLEEYRRMAAGGLSSVRMVFFSGFPHPSAGVSDWRSYDQVVGDAARGGITIDPTLFGLPRWMTPNPATLPLHNAGQTQFWFSFVRDAARRYGPGGTFWAQHPELPPHPMHSWEVWNEPNINEFAGQQTVVSAREYARLLRVTRAALDAANPANRIVVGGLYRRPRPGHGIRMTRFLQRLYKLKRGQSLFDAVAIHPYAARPKQILKVSRSARRVMNTNGDPNRPLWITEVGWTTGGNYWARSLYRASLQEQAARVGRVARLLIANRRVLRLRRVDWMTWRDFSGGDHFWSNYMGLFAADGQPKPAWGAFTRVTGGYAGGQITDLGHKPVPALPPPAHPPTTGGGGGTQPPPPHCLLPGLLC